jgi:hypothetical protein
MSQCGSQWNSWTVLTLSRAHTTTLQFVLLEPSKIRVVFRIKFFTYRCSRSAFRLQPDPSLRVTPDIKAVDDHLPPRLRGIAANGAACAR